MDNDKNNRENFTALGIRLRNLCLDHESQKVGEEDDQASLGNKTTAPTTDTEIKGQEVLLADVDEPIPLSACALCRKDFPRRERLRECKMSHELAIEWGNCCSNLMKHCMVIYLAFLIFLGRVNA